MKRKKLEFSITVAIHIVTAIVSVLLAIAVLSVFHKLTPEFFKVGNQAIIPALMPVLIAECLTLFVTMYDGKYAFKRVSIISHIIRCLVITLIVAGIWAVILLIQKNEISQSRYFFVATIITHFILLTFSYACIQGYIIGTYYKTHNASLVMVVSDKEHATIGSNFIKKDWSRKISSIALIDEEDITAVAEQGIQEIDHVPVVAGRLDLIDWVCQHAIDEVFFFINDENDKAITDALQSFVRMGISVHVRLDSVSVLNHTVEAADPDYFPHVVKFVGEFVDRVPMASYSAPQPQLRYLFCKRLMDLAGGIVGSVFAAILFAVLGAIIKLDSPGPILFAQERVGRNGRTFKIYKFRSMYIDAEERKAALMQQNEMNGLMFKIKDDPRITPVGRFIRKTSLDEFPQFFNVLKGDMSLVGTRPPTVAEFKQYSDYHKRRLAMKPGITGMWQVSGRSDIKNFEDVVKLDCSYIDNWSLGLDIKILFKTVLIVCTGNGSE